MEICQYPIQALAIYDPTLAAIETRSAQLLRVNKWSHQYVVNEASSGSNVLVVGKTQAGELVPVSVLSDGTVNVAFDSSPGIQKGACTNPTTTGYIPYDETAYVTLDSIPLLTGQALNIHGIHSTGDLQAVVELVENNNDTITRLLVGVVSESDPNWDPPFGAPIEVVATANITIQLRIKSLRCPGETGEGSGRIFARLV